MSRLGSFIPPEISTRVRRRPNLPGVTRRAVPGSRLGNRNLLPPGFESFVNFDGLDAVGGTTRGTPQQRADLFRQVGLQGARGAGNLPPSGFPPLPSPIGAENIGQPGPDTLAGAGVTPDLTGGRFATGGPSFRGQAIQANQRNAARQQRETIPTPGISPETQRQRAITGAAAAQGRLRQGSILPPVPFQSFDDFFAARNLARQFQIQEQNPAPFGGGGRDAAAPPAVPQAAGPPRGSFDAGGPRPEVSGGGVGGINLGLLENQALFAALRDALLGRLIPGALGVR